MARITEDQVLAAAAAIANIRAGRRGAPPISNVLEMLQKVLPKVAPFDHDMSKHPEEGEVYAQVYDPTFDDPEDCE